MSFGDYVQKLQKILEENPEYKNLDIIYKDSFDYPHEVYGPSGVGYWNEDADKWTLLENELDDIFDDDNNDQKKDVKVNAFCIN